MGRSGQKSFLVVAMISMCELTVLQAALAEPPLQKGAALLSHGAKSTEHEAPRLELPRLDLRAPSQNFTGGQTPAAPLLGNHRLFDNDSVSRTEQAGVAQSGHINSPLQNVVHNFQREGLPIARLFQSESSLVHLGLNPKGKPGLWVVHKLH